MSFKYLILFLLVFTEISCYNPGDNKDTVTWKPEYFSAFQLGQVQYKNPITLTFLPYGVYKSYILLLEPYEGIHLVKNINDPTDILFWAIPGITDFTLDNEKIIFKLMKDEIIIDISNENVPTLISKTSLNDVDINSLSPFNLKGSFECVEPSNGYIRRWSSEVIFDPKCWK